jgi:hypothetical protein
VKPVNLNQLLFHSHTLTVSFFHPPLKHHADPTALDAMLVDLMIQLDEKHFTHLSELLEKNRGNIKKILKSHPEKSHGFFFSEELQGYMILDKKIDAYHMVGKSFYVRPILEELLVNPEFMVVNVSLYDIQVFRGDFHSLEIVQQYEFDQLPQGFQLEERSRIYTPQFMGLIPYKAILALKTIANKVKEITVYDSIPVIVTGLEDMKEIFLNFFDHPGIVITDGVDFYEKTCSEILESCQIFRPQVMDYYSLLLQQRLKKMVKLKRLLSDLDSIIKAVMDGKVMRLILPSDTKILGRIDFSSREYEICSPGQQKNNAVDILNEIAEEVVKQGGKIQILGTHFFPQDTAAMAVLKG